MTKKYELTYWEARWTEINDDDSFSNDTKMERRKFDTEEEARLWCMGKILDKNFKKTLQGDIKLHEVEISSEVLEIFNEKFVQSLLKPPRQA